MATVPAEVQNPSDGELLEQVRGGSSQAYGELYERHVAAAYNMARQVAKSAAEADDLVSEAFAKVLDALREGRGPTSAFRAYLLTSLRHAAYDRTRRERKVQLADDVAEVSGADVSVPFTDTAVAGLERTLAAQAFSRLPERWQTVLWHIEIEGQSPAEIAPLLGLTPNGVSALAYRAREGLRQAYLQVHLGQLEASGDGGVQQCRAAVDRLGAWTRDGLSKRETAQVETHLDTCDRCRALAAELADVNGALRVIIAPLVLGVTTTGYLASISSGGTAAGALVAGGAASGAGGAAGEAASAGPRQAATAGVAGTVLAAAIAVAMTSGTDQSIPVAQAPAPPPAAEPAAPPPPAPPAAPPAAPPPAPAPAAPPAAPPPAPAPAPAPPPPPPAVTPAINATGPAQPVQLVAGGAPVSVPIKVTNGGSGPSVPVTSTMSLPPGVTAQLPAAVPGSASSTPQSASGRPASTSPQSASPRSLRAQAAGTPSVTCDGQTGTITCTTDRGLQPGESMVFDYLVRADESATGGEITVTVAAGSQIDLRLPSVPVIVEPAPEPEPPKPVDDVDLHAWAWDQPWMDVSRVAIGVRNTGTSTGRAEVVAELPEGVEADFVPAGCTATSDVVTCAQDDLAPHEGFYRELWVSSEHDHPGWPWWPVHDPDALIIDGRHQHHTWLPITAKLGEATDQQAVRLRVWAPWWPPKPPRPPEPTSPPTTTSTNTSTPTSTRPDCPPWWPPGHTGEPWPPGHGNGHDRPWEHDDPHCRPPSHERPVPPQQPSPTTVPQPTTTVPPTTAPPTTAPPPMAPTTTAPPPTSTTTPSPTTTAPSSPSSTTTPPPASTTTAPSTTSSGS